MKKLIIEARINEYMMREAGNTNVPYTPEEIASESVACRDAGAAIVHFHARKPDGTPEHSAEVYSDIIRRIRRASDILVHPTLGYNTMDDHSAEGRLRHIVELAKDKSVAPHFVQDYVVAHEVAHLRHMNHGPRFWAFVDTLTPHTRAAVAWLRDEGPRLMRVGP
jgi:uncharacterized protein (DUF849 family)